MVERSPSPETSPTPDAALFPDAIVPPQAIGETVTLLADRLNPEALRDVVEDKRLAILGLRRAWADRKLRHTVSSLGEQATDLENFVPKKPDITTERRRGVASAIYEGSLPKGKDSIVSGRDRRLANRQAKRREKLVNNALEQMRLGSIYGPIDAYGRPRLEKNEAGNDLKVQALPVITRYQAETKPVRDRYEALPDSRYRFKWGRVVKDTRGISVPKPNDLGTPEQEERLADGTYSKKRLSAEEAAAARLHLVASKASQLQKEADQAMGLRDKAKDKLIKKVDRKAKNAQRLDSKVQHLTNTEQYRRQELARRRAIRSTPVIPSLF